MKRLLIALTALAFLSGCVSSGTSSTKKRSADAQRSRADQAFSELDGKAPSKQSQARPKAKATAKAPAPQTAISEATHLVAKGYGQSKPEAIRQAKAELANIFESRIQSDISSVTQSITDSREGDALKKVVEAKIRVASSVELAGVQVGEVKREDGEYVAIAVLNRARAASSWQKEMAKIDGRIAVEINATDQADGKLMKLRHINSALSLFVEKEVYVSRMSVIGYEAPQATRLNFSELAALRQGVLSDFRIALDVVSQNGNELSHQLAKKLTQQGFMVQTNTRNSDATLKVTLGLSKVVNNNPNFKFMRATADVAIVDPVSGEKVGHFNESQRGAHLNYHEAGVKAVKKLSGTLSKKIVAYFN